MCYKLWPAESSRSRLGVQTGMFCPAPDGWPGSTLARCCAADRADPLHAGHPVGHAGFSILH